MLFMPIYWYFIRNERLGRSIDMAAQSAEAACRDLCWAIDDCVVIQVGQVYDSRHPPEGREREPKAQSAKGRGRTGS
jgi:hypothetical protein